MRQGRRRGAGASWSSARGGPTSRKLASRWSHFAWCTTSLNGCAHRSTGSASTAQLYSRIKCPLNVRDQGAAKAGSVPPHYYAQLQHELEVSRAEELHYWSFDGSAGSLVRVRPDRDYLKRLLDAEAAFWRLVRENVWPEPAGDELDLSADPKWRHIALRYREVKVRLETAAAEEHKLRAMLENLATARRTYGCGVELLRSSRKGAVDYATVPELRGVNLEPYRKPPVPVVRINFLESDVR